MRTVMIKLAFLVVLFMAPNCGTPAKPPETPQPSPVSSDPIIPEEPAYKPEAGVPVKRSPCQRACQRMVELGCIDGEVTPAGHNCEDTFCSISGRWDFACMERARDCVALNRCNP